MRFPGRQRAFRAAPALTQRLGLVHVQAALLVNTDPQRGLQAAQAALEAAIVHRPIYLPSLVNVEAGCTRYRRQARAAHAPQAFTK